MTETETMEAKGTAIALPEASALAAMFKADNGLDDLIKRIADQATLEAVGLDPKNAAHRKTLRSIAYRVAQTKAEIERRAKELTEQQRREVAAVNASRNTAVERLDALRDSIKKPAEDWEAAEKARVDEITGRLNDLSVGEVTPFSTPEEIEARIEHVTRVSQTDFTGYEAVAEDRTAKALKALNIVLQPAKERVARDAELERLRAEAEARRIADAEAEERAAEAQRAAQIEADRAEAARLAAAEAELRAAAQIEAARRDTEAALAKAEADRIAAVEAERARAEQERQAREAEEARRAADIAHVTQVRRSAKEALMEHCAVDEATATTIVKAVMAGLIPNVSITY